MSRLKKHAPILITLIIIGVYILVAGRLPNNENSSVSFEKALVKNVIESNLKQDEHIPQLKTGYQIVDIEILTGAKTGDVYRVQNNMSRLFNTECKEGSTIITGVDLTGKSKYPASVYGYYREPVIFTLVGLFFAVLVVFGGMKGIKTIITLIITGVCLIFGMFPMIFSGHSPIWSAILAIGIITISSFIWISGWNRKSLSAIMGTIIGVVIAGLISHFASEAANLLGLATEDGERLIYIAYDYNIQITGLLFASILIASLGAIMDVAMSIASSMFEIHSHNKSIGSKALLKSGINVGRDVMGTMSNTLILAFAGGSLNLVIFIVAYGMPFHQFMNMDLVCIELIQGLAGSIGIVLTVPVTAAISVLMLDQSKAQFLNKLGFSTDTAA